MVLRSVVLSMTWIFLTCFIMNGIVPVIFYTCMWLMGYSASHIDDVCIIVSRSDLYLSVLLIVSGMISTLLVLIFYRMFQMLVRMRTKHA